MRSPLKDKPLRNPGQSLDDKLTDYAFDVLFYAFIALMFCMFAAMEWVRTWTNAPPMPLLWSGIAAISIVIGLVRVRPIFAKWKNVKLGRDGEKAVGQHLERLREYGADIFHDIRGRNFNIDHVVISPKGIFVIETKAWSKPESGTATIEFDGSIFKKNGFRIDPSPTVQALACSKYLKELLVQTTGREFSVQPIVTFPGWYVEHTAAFNKNQPWVLNPKALTKFILNSNNCLSFEDTKLASYHLSRHIRTT